MLHMEDFNVGIFVPQGAEPLDFTGPFEVFNNAGFFKKDIKIKVFIIGETMDPINAQGLSINATYSIEDHPPLNILLIPGGGTGRVLENPVVISWVESIQDKVDNLLSVCTGSLVYAKAGILEGMTITSHYQSLDTLAKLAPGSIIDSTKRYIDNGKVVTSAGISAGIDMSLYMLEKLWGFDLAFNVAKYMEYNWERTEENISLDHLDAITAK